MTEGGGGITATVVITTHTRPELGRRALASALAQTLPGVEVVVVDDGSQPPFESKVDRRDVRVIRIDVAGGVSAARNVGLGDARGEWITFLDDDDVLEPTMLDRSLTAAAAASSTLARPVAVMSGVAVLDVDGGVAGTLVPAAELVRGADFMLERRGAAGRAANSLVVPTALMRDIGGFDEHLESFQHDDLGLRVNEAASIVGIEDALYRMTSHPAARVSARWHAIPADMERTLAKHPEAFSRHRAAHARYMGVAGFYHLKAGHWAEAIRWGARAVRRDPRDQRCWFYLAAALAGPFSLRLYQRVVPSESVVSFRELTRRRAGKYGARVGAYPRAAVGAPIAFVTRAAVDRSSAVRAAARLRSVLLVCIYRAENEDCVRALTREAHEHGWTVRLWSLDRTVHSLECDTVGVSSGPKFPLLNALVADQELGAFDWLVVADDDVDLQRGSIDALLDLAEAAELDLFQPAHTELSHFENVIARRRAWSIARQTSFVEIGPLFAVRAPWIERLVPFPPEHGMGWGLELEWSDLAAEGLRLGIVDALPLRHLGAVGRGYAKQEERDRLRALLRARGLDSFGDAQRTLATWRPWRSVPPWSRRRSVEGERAHRS